MTIADTHAASYRMTGFALAFVGTMLFGLKAIFVKLGFNAGGNTEQMMILRSLFSLPVFLVVGVIAWRNRKQPIRLQDIASAAGLGWLSWYVCTWLDLQSLNYISVQLERLILMLYPTITALLARIFFKDRLTLQHGIALGLSYVGVILLAGPEAANVGPEVWKGVGLVGTATILFGAYVTMSKSVITRLGSQLFTCVAMSAAALGIGVHTLVQTVAVGAPLPAFTPPILINGVALALFSTVLSAFAMNEGVSRIGPGLSSAVGSAGPIMTAIAAVVVLHEPFGWPHAASLVLTMLGLWLLVRAPVAKTSS